MAQQVGRRFLQICYLGELMDDSGLRTVRCYAMSISGWTEKRANAIAQPLCFAIDRDSAVSAGEGALGRY